MKKIKFDFNVDFYFYFLNKMVLSEIEKKERRRESNRKYTLANKERLLEKSKQYRIANKEKIIEKRKRYRKTPQSKKSTTISCWKYNGLILPLPWYSILYDYYINTHRCEVCNNEFKSKRDRHMDHCHETGQFRWILCCSCNTYDNWKKKKYNTNI